MVTIKRFEDLRVWREALELNKKIYRLFSLSKEYWLRNQILRSSLSVHSNIAEGFDRTTNKEYLYFLSIARASCSEMRSQLILSKELKVSPPEIIADLITDSNRISAMLNKLMKVRRERF